MKARVVKKDMNISKNTLMADIYKMGPAAVKVLQKYGFDCAGCKASEIETLERAANSCGASLNAVLSDLSAAEKTGE